MENFSVRPSPVRSSPVRLPAARPLALLLILLTVLGGMPRAAWGYSFLTHDDMIDMSWQPEIRSLLLARFPTATAAQLQEARAYAYGGATIQDMGYYPFGHQFFSNLTHYVRPGAFVNALFRDAQTVDEYAFAIGALSHYVGDNNGHRYATNLSTPVEFPGLGKKYGPVVTYDQAPYAHIRTEFAYDVEQYSQHQLAPPGYMKSIGFRVPERLLRQAFYDTYGLPLGQVLGRPRPAIESYQTSVKKLLPEVARAEVLVHRNDFPKEDDTPAYHEFTQRHIEAAQEYHWARYRRNAGFRIHMLAFVIRILPPIGPLSCLSIRGPNAETNRWYIESRNRAAARYDGLLRRLRDHPRRPLDLEDRDLDTGSIVRPGTYPLTDKTYAQLLRALTTREIRIPADLKRNILAYYSDPDAPISTKKNAKAWKRVQQELQTLRAMPTVDV